MSEPHSYKKHPGLIPVLILFVFFISGCFGGQKNVSNNPDVKASLASPLNPAEKPEQQLFKEKKYAQVVEILEKKLAEKPDDFDTLKFLADCCYMMKDTDRSLKIANKLVERDPENADVHLLLGNIYLYREEDGKKAVYHFKKTLEKRPDDNSTFLNLMEAYFLDNQLFETIVPLEKYLQKHPDDDRAMVILGEAYIECGRLPDAQKLLKVAAKKKPDDANRWILLGESYMDHKQFDKSLSALEISRSLDPNNPDVYLDIGEIYYWRGDYEKGEKLIRRASSMDPSYFSPYNELGNLYFLKKDYKTAEYYHKESLKRYPGYYDAYKGLGKVYLARKEYDKAEKAFRKAIELKPLRQGETYMFLADFYKMRGNDKEAENCLIKATKTDRHFPAPYKKLIKFYQGRGESQKASEVEELMKTYCTPEKMTYKTGQ